MGAVSYCAGELFSLMFLMPDSSNRVVATFTDGICAGKMRNSIRSLKYLWS